MTTRGRQRRSGQACISYKHCTNHRQDSGVVHMQMAKFLQHKLNIVRWVGLGALVIQVRSFLGKTSRRLQNCSME